MPYHTVRSRPFPSVVRLASLALLLIAGLAACGEQGTQAPPASAKSEPAAKAPATPAPAAPTMAKTAETQKAAESMSKATPPAAKAPVDEHAGHDHAAETAAAATAKAMAPGDDIKIDPNSKLTPEALLKSADPHADVDPDSKAKLTYEFGTDSKNFGKVVQGDVLNHKFELKSSGEEDLVIKQAKPTCGCTLAQIAVEDDSGKLVPYTFGGAIPPGRKIEISATLHTQNKNGHAGSRINVFSNDPRGQIQLALEADVELFFLVNPMNLNFNALSVRDTATEKLSISTNHGERIHLAAVMDTAPPGLRAELKPLDADAEGKATRWELTATAGPGLNEGNLAWNLLLRSDLPIPGAEKTPNGHVPTYEVAAMVLGRVTGVISFEPAFISLGLIRPGQVISRTVRVKSTDPDHPLSAPEVVVQGRDGVEWEYAKYFTTSVKPVAGENSVDVEVRLDGMPDTLNGSFAGTLIVKTGHPEKPELKLPITGVCRGGTATPTATPGPK